MNELEEPTQMGGLEEALEPAAVQANASMG